MRRQFRRKLIIINYYLHMRLFALDCAECNANAFPPTFFGNQILHCAIEQTLIRGPIHHRSGRVHHFLIKARKESCLLFRPRKLISFGRKESEKNRPSAGLSSPESKLACNFIFPRGPLSRSSLINYAMAISFFAPTTV